MARYNQAEDFQYTICGLIINLRLDPLCVRLTEARVVTEYFVNIKSIQKDAIIAEVESRITVDHTIFVVRILEPLNCSNKCYT